jgi:hypothetical protein
MRGLAAARRFCESRILVRVSWQQNGYGSSNRSGEDMLSGLSLSMARPEAISEVW